MVGFFTAIVTWPLAPVRGVVSLAELIQRRVDQEMNNPATTRKQLEELEEARERGEITREEENRAQDEIIEARITPGAASSAPSKDG
jgi:cytochrome c-type biogenesis protein CcmH/NrfG